MTGLAMNGYERHSDDYGGPPTGWGTRLMIALVIGAIVVLVVVLALSQWVGG